jgi:hypothetical protein
MKAPYLLAPPDQRRRNEPAGALLDMESELPVMNLGMIGKSSPAEQSLSILGNGFPEAVCKHCDELVD